MQIVGKLCQLSARAATMSSTDDNIEEDKIKKRKLFGSDLPHGVRDAKDAKYVAEMLLTGERKLVFDALRKKSALSTSVADQYLEHKRLGNAEIHPDDLVKIW
ncbi:unnamed protein product [Strongylus vulgaris]|uniref:Uncharacterized protein n=1 Tax=Strongylus vulgaris TaxID=40348 RepID=A0A3P7J146_STRVU|nr:unnamed protein product [Strongylus vulgaris]